MNDQVYDHASLEDLQRETNRLIRQLLENQRPSVVTLTREEIRHARHTFDEREYDQWMENLLSSIGTRYD